VECAGAAHENQDEHQQLAWNEFNMTRQNSKHILGMAVDCDVRCTGFWFGLIRLPARTSHGLGIKWLLREAVIVLADRLVHERLARHSGRAGEQESKRVGAM